MPEHARPPIEPSAAHRTLARQLRELHLALVAEDFTEPQALAIVGHVIAASYGDSK